jgi:O-antigen ligase/polysaccharide polymerase Wzy-like membrane protein
MPATGRNRGSELGTLALAALPGALLVYLAFNSGGMFELTTAFAAVFVLAVAAVASALAPRPLAGLAPRGLAAIGLLALLAIVTLLSGSWSGAAGRAAVGFDRVLLYLAVLALFACLPRSADRFRWVLRFLLAAAAAVALIGLLSRLLPAVWPTAPGLVSDRLAYPITYWNSFGMLVAIATVLAAHHAADEREPGWVRVTAAALLPGLAATLLLTFSRGAIAVAVAGIVVYALAARPRGLPGAAIAALPATAAALIATNAASLVHEGTPLTPAALGQAHELAWILAACTAGAAILRAATLPLDNRLAEAEVSARAARRAWAIGAGAVAVLVLAFLLAGGASTVRDQYDRAVEAVDSSGGQSARLFTLGSDGRQPLWETAESSFSAAPVAGHGAGTFQLAWQRSDGRPDRFYAYSLYLETAAELGVVGLVLLVATLLVLLIGAAVLIRGPDRAAYAAGFALILAWALHAGLDLDWQTPAVSVPVFALGGLALARSRQPAGAGAERARSGLEWLDPVREVTAGALRPVLPLACLAIAVLPAQQAIAHSQLDAAVKALGAGDCGAARSDAEAATSTADVGPRPDEVLAICAARAGNAREAVRRAEAAVDRDPESWEPHFVLALVRGAAGLDPRPQLRLARAADPSRELLRIAAREFAVANPEGWRRAARSLPFAIE